MDVQRRHPFLGKYRQKFAGMKRARYDIHGMENHGKGGRPIRPPASPNDFGQTLKRWREERQLTQRGLGLPASTVAEWERGRRRPRGRAQVERLARALALPPEVVWEALGEEPPADSGRDPSDVTAAYRATREALGRAYRAGDTAQAIALQETLQKLSEGLPADVIAAVLAGRVTDPTALADLGGVFYYMHQWPAARLMLERAIDALPATSPLCPRVHSNLGIVNAALGDLERALEHDHLYLEYAEDLYDAWLGALAHAQWVQHQILIDAADEAIGVHLAALRRWHDQTDAKDAWIGFWIQWAETEVAYAREDFEALRLGVQALNLALEVNPGLESERLFCASLNARLLALEGRPDRGVETLLRAIDERAGKAPRSTVLLARHTLTRLALQARDARAQAWRDTLIAEYRGLGATGWIERLLAEDP